MSLTLIWNITKPLIEISILWFVFYRILAFFEGTRAFQVLKGVIILVVAFLIAQRFELNTLEWLLTKFFAISIVGVLIIFQPELRRGLARLGQQHLFTLTLKKEEMEELIREICQAVEVLSRRKNGAIIALERTNILRTYAESGIRIDSRVSSELIRSIFMPLGPLHDGGIIIQGERIVAAVCVFPLSENPNFSKTLGTRHRAAVGLTEQTDAICIVVSEETGKISLAVDGKLFSIANRSDLEEELKLNMIIQKRS
jgi:diadenylate cyclase